jgi:hypothetical protein
VTQIVGPTGHYDVAVMLVDAISIALAATPSSGPVNRACVVPGSIAWDECDCGMLAISPRRWVLSDDFPQGEFGGLYRATPCELPIYVGELVIQVIRCAPTPQGASISVPCAQMQPVARQVVSDAWVALTATTDLLCTLKKNDQIIDFVFEDQTAEGPSGGCTGTEITVRVGLYRWAGGE